MVAPGHDKATLAWWSVIERKQAGPGGQPASWGLHGYTSQFHQIEENRGGKFEGEEKEGSLTMGRLGKQGKWPGPPPMQIIAGPFPGRSPLLLFFPFLIGFCRNSSGVVFFFTKQKQNNSNKKPKHICAPNQLFLECCVENQAPRKSRMFLECCVEKLISQKPVPILSRHAGSCP